MTAGNQTITFVGFSDTGTPVRVGTYKQGEHKVDVPYCRHRTLSSKEAAEYDLNTSTQVWKTTVILSALIPTQTAAVLGLQADGELRDTNGAAFKVIAGPEVFPDLDGEPFKVTILSQRKVT